MNWVCMENIAISFYYSFLADGVNFVDLHTGLQCVGNTFSDSYETVIDVFSYRQIRIEMLKTYVLSYPTMENPCKPLPLHCQTINI